MVLLAAAGVSNGMLTVCLPLLKFSILISKTEAMLHREALRTNQPHAESHAMMVLRYAYCTVHRQQRPHVFAQ